MKTLRLSPYPPLAGSSFTINRINPSRRTKRRSWATQLIESIGCLLARSGSILLLSLVIVDLRAAEMKTIQDFQDAAAKANAALTIPDWEQTPEAVDSMMKNAIDKANKALDQIGRQDLGKVTFTSTIIALDDLGYEASLAANRATIIKETNTNAAMRTAGEHAVKAYQEWLVGIDYREDVYKAMKAFAETNPKLSGEDKKLFDETMRDYRRAGLALPNEKRKQVEDLRKQLAKLGTDFDTNIVNTKARSFLQKPSWTVCPTPSLRRRE